MSWITSHFFFNFIIIIINNIGRKKILLSVNYWFWIKRPKKWSSFVSMSFSQPYLHTVIHKPLGQSLQPHFSFFSRHTAKFFPDLSFLDKWRCVTEFLAMKCGLKMINATQKNCFQMDIEKVRKNSKVLGDRAKWWKILGPWMTHWNLVSPANHTGWWPQWEMNFFFLKT